MLISLPRTIALVGAWSFRALCLGAIALGFGCATAPTQEMSEARLAIRSAQELGATHRSPYDLQVAVDLLRQAQLRLAVGEYSDARYLAQAARVQAVRARHQAAADD